MNLVSGTDATCLGVVYGDGFSIHLLKGSEDFFLVCKGSSINGFTHWEFFY